MLKSFRRESRSTGMTYAHALPPFKSRSRYSGLNRPICRQSMIPGVKSQYYLGREYILTNRDLCLLSHHFDLIIAPEAAYYN